MEKRFNLIDKPWVPVADAGRISLRQIFSNPEYRSLGGNPVQKIALVKLLLAIAQSACTPANEHEWQMLGAQTLAQRCDEYLTHWHEEFYLYGDKPFLQMQAISAAAIQSYGAVLPEVSTGNTTVLSQGQAERKLEDAEKALLLVSLMGFALSGKKTDNTVTLTLGYQGKRNDKGKPSSGRAGPSVAYMGLLHSYFIGHNLWETLWLNLLTTEQIQQANIFPGGVGRAPWEQMPEGEDCAVARTLKQSLMGRLIPICRFCLLEANGLHYSEGLAHPSYKDGVTDPTAAVDYSGKDPKALWVNPEKRPWRELTALLNFVALQKSRGVDCLQIRSGFERIHKVTDTFAIWSGGLRVSSNAGEQYASGIDDFVESTIWLNTSYLDKHWFAQLQAEMNALDDLAKGLYGRVIAFFKEQKVDGAKLAALASNLFWQLCERDFQRLVNNCQLDEQSTHERHHLRLTFSEYVLYTYDHYCPKETARQLDAWARCRPKLGNYLKTETQT